jgi:hypothetical protein
LPALHKYCHAVYCAIFLKDKLVGFADFDFSSRNTNNWRLIDNRAEQNSKGTGRTEIQQNEWCAIKNIRIQTACSWVYQCNQATPANRSP